MFRGNVLKWSPSKLSLVLVHLMLVPVSHFLSVWQCPMLSRDNSRKHDSIILSRSFLLAWVPSRAPSNPKVIRALSWIPIPRGLRRRRSPDYSKNHLTSRAIVPGMIIIQTERLSWRPKRPDTGASNMLQSWNCSPMFSAKEIVLDYFLPVRVSRPGSGSGGWDVIRQLPTARLRRGEEWAQSEAALHSALRPRFAELWPLCRASIAIIATHCHCHSVPGCPHHTQPLVEASWCQPE